PFVEGERGKTSPLVRVRVGTALIMSEESPRPRRSARRIAHRTAWARAGFSLYSSPRGPDGRTRPELARRGRRTDGSHQPEDCPATAAVPEVAARGSSSPARAAE